RAIRVVFARLSHLRVVFARSALAEAEHAQRVRIASIARVARVDAALPVAHEAASAVGVVQAVVAEARKSAAESGVAARGAVFAVVGERTGVARSPRRAAFAQCSPRAEGHVADAVQALLAAAEVVAGAAVVARFAADALLIDGNVVAPEAIGALDDV